MFKHAGVPVDFDVHYLSEVSYGQSESVEEVVAAVRKTGICLKGHFSVPGMVSHFSVYHFNRHWTRHVIGYLYYVNRAFEVRGAGVNVDAV